MIREVWRGPVRQRMLGNGAGSGGGRLMTLDMATGTQRGTQRGTDQGMQHRFGPSGWRERRRQRKELAERDRRSAYLAELWRIADLLGAAHETIEAGWVQGGWLAYRDAPHRRLRDHRRVPGRRNRARGRGAGQRPYPSGATRSRSHLAHVVPRCARTGRLVPVASSTHRARRRSDALERRPAPHCGRGRGAPRSHAGVRPRAGGSGTGRPAVGGA